jgi:adenosine deaminase
LPEWTVNSTGPVRAVETLPKAHLHLHFTGSMRHSTLVELADRDGVRLPEALRSGWPPELSGADERGWFRFQRLYDVARSVLSRPDDVRRLLREAAEDELADGSGWLEIQVDPSGYAARFGGLSTFTDLVLDAAADAARDSGVGIAVVIAANRTRHPLDARTLARLAAQYAGRGVVGFGLSNDERRGSVADFEPAFRIARRAGLVSDPHAGELCGADSVRAALDGLHAGRVGHGVRAAEDPALLDRIAAAGITLEVCPTSNAALGVYPDLAAVPLRQLLAAGVPVALGADDPLLFGDRLAKQYEIARTVHGLDDAALAALAAMSVRGSAAPQPVKGALLRGVDAWLRGSPGSGDDVAGDHGSATATASSPPAPAR